MFGVINIIETAAYIDVREPVPVLAGGQGAVGGARGGATIEPAAVERALHGHDHGAALVVFLSVVHFALLYQL